MWTLPPRQGKKALPLYKQVVALIERAIEDGLLARGERLPSERRLCGMLRVNRSTIIHALNDLTDRGVLLRRQGSGTYVNHEKWGLQQYPIVNWQPPVALRSPHGGEYAARLERFREEARRDRSPYRDLTGSDLPADLLPSVTMPAGSWQELLRQELDEEASLTGLPEFKKTVRDELRRTLGLHAEPEEILVTSGAQQALFLITQCLLRPGDAVGIEAPSYFYSLPVFQAAGLRLFPIPTDEEGISPDGLDAVASRRGLKMIFLNPIFQNPTGHAMGPARKRDILHYCAARHIPIVEDDAYSLLAFSPRTDTTPIKRLDAEGHVLYLGSLSSYVGKNIRAGWLLAPKGALRKLAEVRRQMDAGLSVLPQLLAGHYLRTAHAAHLAFLRTELARRARALQAALSGEIARLATWSPPQGGFYLYLHPRRDGTGGELLDALLRHGMVPAQGSDFGDAEGRFRLNFGQFRPEDRA